VALLNAATLAVWSFAAGWALGLFARRGIWIPVLAFYGTVLLASLIRNDIGILPRHSAFAAFGVVAAATAVHGAVLVIAPALCGLGWGLAHRPVSVPACGPILRGMRDSTPEITPPHVLSAGVSRARVWPGKN